MHLSPCREWWEIWLSDEQPHYDDNEQWQRRLWQSWNARSPTQTTKKLKNWKMYAMKRIKICAEHRLQPPVTGGLPSRKASNAELWFLYFMLAKQAVEQTVYLPEIWQAMAPIWRHRDGSLIRLQFHKRYSTRRLIKYILNILELYWEASNLCTRGSLLSILKGFNCIQSGWIDYLTPSWVTQIYIINFYQ